MTEGIGERPEHGAWEYEPESGRTRWSESLYAMHGVEPRSFEPRAEDVLPLVHPDDRETYSAIVRDAIDTRTPFACQHRIVRPDGETRILIVRGSFVEGMDEVPDRLIGTTQDVTDRADESARVAHLANHDSVSGLYNRPRFMEELTREIATGRRSGVGGALLILNLDRFADVNSVLGHMAGDQLLRKVAAVLRGRLRDTDILARIGGDVFAMILPGCGPGAAARVATQLIESVAASAAVGAGGAERRASGSIGMAFFGPSERREAEDLLVEAELAVMRAKANGRAQAQAFTEEMRVEQAVSLSTEDELRGAIGGHELRVQFQPIVSLEDGAAIGCEALVRWEHPIKGLMGPGDFVSIAEETGLISKIGRVVLESSCRQAAEWRRQGRDLFVSVNISPRQLMRPDLIADIRAALAASNLPAECLYLEVTETSLLRDPGPIVETLRRLKALGVRLAIDDFGAGASSFGLLRILPIDQIKIDRSFIQGLGDTTSDRAVVAAVVSLAKELGLTVVAEGVETQRQQGELRDLGADLAQGFLYSPARNPEELELDAYAATVLDGVL
ncbi:MAG: EAL domain-containing protein [Actinomycetota bacterium]|nr:EAL domain-containing protein [Actinomycetota bacterium]